MPARRFTDKEKIEILKKVLAEGLSVASTCRNFGISRFTFYKWASLYKSGAGFGKKRVSLRRLDKKREKLILDLALHNPSWSTHKISDFLKSFKKGRLFVSNHGVQNVLSRHGLNTEDLRRKYKLSLNVRTLLTPRLSEYERYQILSEVLEKGQKVANVCRKYHISRYTFYVWLKKYKPERTVSSLSPNKPRGEQHFRYVGHKIREQVLSVVAADPQASVHKIHAALAGQVGHHAVQNFLLRENLNTVDKRILFASEYPNTVFPVAVAPAYIPTMPLYKLRMLLAPFVTVPKLLFTDPKAAIPSLVLLLAPLLLAGFFIRIIFSASTGSPIGLFFASVALVFGTFFFIYSMKYYITILMVLKLAQSGAGAAESSRQKGGQAKLGKLLSKLFNFQPTERVNPLLINLEKVELTSHPFVSIHVALYNETRVVERLIRACTSQKWENFELRTANYELIIADDSNDETTEIAKQALLSEGWTEQNSV